MCIFMYSNVVKALLILKMKTRLNQRIHLWLRVINMWVISLSVMWTAHNCYSLTFLILGFCDFSKNPLRSILFLLKLRWMDPSLPYLQPQLCMHQLDSNINCYFSSFHRCATLVMFLFTLFFLVLVSCRILTNEGKTGLTLQTKADL